MKAIHTVVKVHIFEYFTYDYFTGSLTHGQGEHIPVTTINMKCRIDMLLSVRNGS